MEKKYRPPFKTYNGKYYLASWIIEHFPPEYEKFTYVEPYAGAASVLLNKKPNDQEIINDIDINSIQIFRALRDEPGNFLGRLKRIKYCESTFNRMLSKNSFKDYMDEAVAKFVIRRMSRSGLGKSFDEESINSWDSIIEELPRISDRINNCFIFNKHALEVIKAYNDPNTLLYVDPPDLPETRENLEVYENEMPVKEHHLLAEQLNQFSGKVIISGKTSPMYRRIYSSENHWRCSIKTSNKKNKDYIWMNYTKDGKSIRDINREKLRAEKALSNTK
jgi:DNA adenine methylase